MESFKRHINPLPLEYQEYRNQAKIEELGFYTREDYLCALAIDWDTDETTVFALAEMLGPNEDFDGLLMALEDLQLSPDE